MILAGIGRSVQGKAYCLHFPTYFELIRIKCGLVLKQFKLTFLILLFSEIYGIREIIAVYGVRKCNRWHVCGHLQTDMHQILCRDAIEVYILMLAYVASALIQGHGDVRKQKLLHQLSLKV